MFTRVNDDTIKKNTCGPSGESGSHQNSKTLPSPQDVDSNAESSLVAKRGYDSFSDPSIH